MTRCHGNGVYNAKKLEIHVSQFILISKWEEYKYTDISKDIPCKILKQHKKE